MKIIPGNLNCEVRRSFYDAACRAVLVPWDAFYVTVDQSALMSPEGIEKVRANVQGTIDLLNRQLAVFRDLCWLDDAPRVKFVEATGTVELDVATGPVSLMHEQAWFHANDSTPFSPDTGYSSGEGDIAH